MNDEAIKTTRVKFDASFKCPVCGRVMWNDKRSETMCCINEKCDGFEVKYKLPFVECEVVDEKDNSV